MHVTPKPSSVLAATPRPSTSRPRTYTLYFENILSLTSGTNLSRNFYFSLKSFVIVTKMPLNAESTISLISMFLNLFISLVLVWQNQRFLAVRFRDAALNLQGKHKIPPSVVRETLEFLAALDSALVRATMLVHALAGQYLSSFASKF